MAILLYFVSTVLIAPGVLIALACLLLDKLTEAPSLSQFASRLLDKYAILLYPPVLVATVFATLLTVGVFVCAAWMPEIRSYGFTTLLLAGTCSVIYGAYTLGQGLGWEWAAVMLPSTIGVLIAGHQCIKAFA